MITNVMPTATIARKALPAATVSIRLSGDVKLLPNAAAPATSVMTSMIRAPERCRTPKSCSRRSAPARRSTCTTGASSLASRSATAAAVSRRPRIRPVLRLRWSATAATMISAVTIRRSESVRLWLTSVVLTSCMSSAPMTVPTIRMRPPVSGVPPTTTAVMANSS